jgi:hypothetical protein
LGLVEACLLEEGHLLVQIEDRHLVEAYHHLNQYLELGHHHNLLLLVLRAVLGPSLFLDLLVEAYPLVA